MADGKKVKKRHYPGKQIMKKIDFSTFNDNHENGFKVQWKRGGGHTPCTTPYHDHERNKGKKLIPCI